MNRKTVWIGMLLCTLSACESAGGSEPKAEPSTAQPAVASDPGAAGAASSVAKNAPEPAKTHDEVLKNAAKLKGERVRVKAVSWGTSKRTGGAVQINLGPQKLSGMRQSKLIAVFPSGAEAERFATIEAKVAKDTAVVLECLVDKKSYGALELLECKLE